MFFYDIFFVESCEMASDDNLSTKSVEQRRSAFLDKVKDEAEKYKCNDGCACGLVQATTINDDVSTMIQSFKDLCADYDFLAEENKKFFEENNISREQWNKKSKRDRFILFWKIFKEKLEKEEEEETRNSR